MIDWIGTGFYLALSAIFLTRSAGLTAPEVGLVLAIAGMVAFFGSVHVGRLGDRIGPRQVLLALYVLRAAAFAVLTLVHDLGVLAVVEGDRIAADPDGRSLDDVALAFLFEPGQP